MVSGTTLNARNLQALGAERLAQLLMEVSTGNAAAKRRLRLELAGDRGPGEAAGQIARRLTSLASARGRIGWKSRKTLVADLETQRRGIMEQVAPGDPEAALALMWRFIGLADGVARRSTDGGAAAQAVFAEACHDLARLAGAARPAPEALAEAVLDALGTGGRALAAPLVAALAPVLGPAGRGALKRRLTEGVADPDDRPAPGPERRPAAALSRRLVARALQQIADAEGDVDAYAAQVPEALRTVPSVAVEIAHRLQTAGRAAEALRVLEHAQPTGEGDANWQDARIAALEALGRGDAAQAARWACFERDLAARYLRDHLRRLPDFEDIEAEDRAIAHAMAHPDLPAALGFLLDWRAPDRAAALILRRAGEIDGTRHGRFAPVAEALAEAHPLAATLVLRAMIEGALGQGRSTRYRHAARHMATLAELAARIADFAGHPAHDAYVAKLRRAHGRKYGFWDLVAE